ncbi:MAG: FoF1 ATP synthase subunit delta/epsilon, partial [Planctomycetota bacterium]
SFQAFDGQRGVMPGASPFLTRLGAGLLTLNGPAGNKTMVVDGGFAQMQGDALTLLADSAMPADGIDAKQAADELNQANAKAVSGGGTTEAARDAIERAQAVAHAKVAASRGRGNRN